MCSQVLAIFLLLSILHKSIAQEDLTASASSTTGSCPLWGTIPSFENEGLEKGRYLGRWYRQKHFASWSDIGSQCYSKFYSRKTLENPYKLVVTHNSVSSITGMLSSNTKEVRIEDYADPTLFTPALPLLLKQRYRVIATDYDTFSIEYSCSDSAIMSKSENIWVLTRKRHPSRRILRKALKSLRSLGLNVSKLSAVDQDCDSIPTDPSLVIEDFMDEEEDYYEDQESLRRNSVEEEEYDYHEEAAEDSLNANWKTPVDLARDFMGSLAFVGQAIFAPWTLPGQPFGVDPE